MANGDAIRWGWLAFAIFLFPFSICSAEDVWTLTTGDFRSQAVRLLALDEKGARVVSTAPAAEGGGGEQFVPIEQFLEIDRTLQPVKSPATFVLHLAGGDRIAGQPAGMSSENAIWNNPAVGDAVVPLRLVRAISRVDAQAPAAADINHAEPPAEDLVFLSNGDSVSGIITDLQPEALSIQNGDQAATVDMNTVAAVRFAVVGKSGGGTGAGDNAVRKFRLRLSDGSTLTVASASLTGDRAAVQLIDGSERAVPLATVAAVEQLHGPVAWLSSLTPSQTVQKPFLETSWPTRIDRTLTGQPLRFGQRTYAHGIGVHSYSSLTYALDGSFKAFRTQYAIDGNWSYANVTVRIKLDDRVVHETKDFGAGKLSPVVIVHLGDAKSLTLEVDYGQTYDVQDRFMWLAPALLRDAPAPPPPTTQP